MMEAIDCLKDANFEHTKCARYLTAMMDCYTTQVRCRDQAGPNVR